MGNRWNRTFGVFFCQKIMRDILLCASAFSICMMISAANLFAEPVLMIDKQDYSWMECESLYDRDYSIETESGRVKAAVECFFRGHYPLGPTPEL